MSQLKAIVTLDTGEKSEYIHIYEGDDVELLADFFCERHNILNEGKQYIIQEIMKQLNEKQPKSKPLNQVKGRIQHSQSQACFVKKTDYVQANKMVQKKQDQPAKLSLHSRGQSNIVKQQVSEKCHTNVPRTSRQDQINLANRLISQKSISEKRLQQMRFESKSPESFQPKITKDRIFNKVSKKVDQEDYVLALISKGRRKIFEQNQPKIAVSQIQTLKNIFFQLDGDNDGQISSQFINLNINHQVLEKISPVLLHMEEQHLILDFDSFSQLIRSFNILIY